MSTPKPAGPAASRLFLALTPNGAASRQLLSMQRALQERHATACAGAVRWIAARQFHLTLSFLGDPQGWRQCPPDPLAAIQACAERVCGQSEPLDLEIEARLLIFGEPQLPKAVVADVGRASRELSALQAALVRELVGLGFEPEARPFTPHVSLARIKHQGDVERWVHPVDAEPTATNSARFISRDAVLYGSAMTEQGGVYTKLARFALGRPR